MAILSLCDYSETHGHQVSGRSCTPTEPSIVFLDRSVSFEREVEIVGKLWLIRYDSEKIFINDGNLDLGSGERNLIHYLIRFLFMQRFATKDLEQRTWILLQ